MRGKAVSVLLLALASLNTAAMVAQETSGLVAGRPNFSGKWVVATVLPSHVVDPLSPSGFSRLHGLGATLGSSFTARQDAQTLVVEMGGPVKRDVTVRLDGTESAQTFGTGSFVSRASWQASRLMMTMRDASMPWGDTSEVRRMFSMDADGQLVIETTTDNLTGTTIYRRGE